MRKDFEKWMKRVEHKKQAVVVNYANAINRISQHYSNETGKNINIYQIDNISLLKSICKEYRKGAEGEKVLRAVFSPSLFALFAIVVQFFVSFVITYVSVFSVSKAVGINYGL
jgi:hypothetical protein